MDRRWWVAFAGACACSSKDPPAAPVTTSPVTPAVVTDAAVDAAAAAWPALDCDKLLALDEIKALCKVPKLTARKDGNEGTISEGPKPNPPSKTVCLRIFELPGRGEVGSFSVVAYPDETWPVQLAKVWKWEVGAVNFKQHATAAYTRRDLDGVTKRYSWNLFETDERGESAVCTDEQWRTLARRMADRL